jgi:Pectate lyase superfamily protein/Right handed beta helix region
MTSPSPGPTRRALLAGLAALPLASRATSATPTGGLAGIVSIVDWIPVDMHARIARAIEDRDLTPFIQRAFDEAPLGGTVYFPPGDYRTRAPLRLTRQINLWGDAARLVGFFGTSDQSTLLEIALVSAANGNDDARRMRIDGLSAYFASGGGDVLAILAGDRQFDRTPRDAIGNLGMVIERCGLSAPTTGPGVALRIEGFRTQAHIIRDCDIANSIFLRCADGVTITGNRLIGERPGVILDLHEGAFKTEVSRNLITSRDGAIMLHNGSQVDIIGNQIEQPSAQNRSPQAAHIVIQPTRYASHDCRIIGNNFGAGTNLKRSIWCVGGDLGIENLSVADNVFNIAGSGPGHVDIELADAAVRWTRIGANSARGARSGVDPAAPLGIVDRGTGSYGVRHDAAMAAIGAGWRATSDFRFWKSLDDMLHFSGAVEQTTKNATASALRLPEGFRPRTRSRGIGAGDRGPVMIDFATDGGVHIKSADSVRIDLAALAFPVAGRARYAPGA